MANNPNLREALDLARRLGCIVEPVRRNGEVRIYHPTRRDLGRVNINARRKDTPRALLVLLKNLST